MHITGRCYFLSGIIVILGIYGQWVGGGTVEIWRIPAVFLVLALIIEAVRENTRQIALQRNLPAQGYLGRKLTGNLFVHNQSNRLLRFRAIQEMPAGLGGNGTILAWSLNPGEQSALPFFAVPEQLGTINWKIIYSRSLGMFGLAWWSKKNNLLSSVIIQPVMLHYGTRYSGNHNLGETLARRTGSGSELIQLREYQYGDPLRMIDWKATARKQMPMAKVFTEDQHLEVMVLIDCGRLSSLNTKWLTRLNHFINCAARLAQYAIDNNDRVGLISFAEQPMARLPPVNTYSGLLLIRKLLGSLRPLSKESNPLPAVACLSSLIKHRCLVVIFTDVEGDYLQSSLLRAVKLLTPKHLPLIATLEDEEIKSIAKSPAQTWQEPYQTLAAQEFENSRQEAIVTLQHHGAQIVSATPDRLDKAVLNRYQMLRARRRI